jgi:IS605 OrfB family transposase
MKLVLQMQLLPTPEQAAKLVDTMRAFNDAATFAARLGFDAGVFSRPSLHKLAYYEIRERFGLSAQLAVHAVFKAADCFSRDKKICPVFRADGSISYDPRNMSFKGLDKVSLSTLTGRELIGMVYGEYQAERFDRLKGQCDLVHRDGKFFLLAMIDLPEPPPLKVKAFLGVDLGITNLAVDSEGEKHAGKKVERNRRRRSTARKQYQRVGTKNAKRRLQAMSGRQRRFQTITNHEISKKIVASAKALRIGIAMEDLTFIRDRIEDSVSRKQRRMFGNWGFAQLRDFVSYKARLAGVPLAFVDPRNTSRTCSQCGHCEKANRQSQAKFVCRHCGLSMNADKNAALNISALGLTAYNAALARALGLPTNPAPKAAVA